MQLYAIGQWSLTQKQVANLFSLVGVSGSASPRIELRTSLRLLLLPHTGAPH